MSWSDTGGWATQTWAFNNRLQMTDYTYGGPGGSINHSYLYSTTANDGKLWRRQDNVSGEVVEYQYDSIHRLISAGTVTGTVTGRTDPLQLRPETWFTVSEHRSKPSELVISGRCEAPAISAREAALRLRPRRALSSALAG